MGGRRDQHLRNDESGRVAQPVTVPVATPAEAVHRIVAGPGRLDGSDATRRAAALVGQQAGNAAMVQRLTVQRDDNEQDFDLYGGQAHNEMLTQADRKKIQAKHNAGLDKSPLKPAWSTPDATKKQSEAEDKRLRIANTPDKNFRQDEPLHGTGASHGPTHMTSKDIAALAGLEPEKEKKKGNWFSRLFRRGR